MTWRRALARLMVRRAVQKEPRPIENNNGNNANASKFIHGITPVCVFRIFRGGEGYIWPDNNCLPSLEMHTLLVSIYNRNARCMDVRSCNVYLTYKHMYFILENVWFLNTTTNWIIYTLVLCNVHLFIQCIRRGEWSTGVLWKCTKSYVRSSLKWGEVLTL